MAEPASQASTQARLQQAQPSGTSGSNANSGSASGNSDPARPGLSQQQWASQKKAQVRAFPRAKKLEKLGVFSACKVQGMAKLRLVLNLRILFRFIRVLGYAPNVNFV